LLANYAIVFRYILPYKKGKTFRGTRNLPHFAPCFISNDAFEIYRTKIDLNTQF